MKLVAGLAALLLSAGAAHAQYINKLAASGKPVRLDFAYATNPDCTSAGYATIRVLQAPQNGRLEITKTKSYPSFPPHNPRSECNRRRVPGVLIRYISKREFVGVDHVVIEGIFPDGSDRGKRRYTIKVK